VKNFDTDKGSVTRRILSMEEYDFVLAAGDDRTDEDMFSVLKESHHYTIKIGKDNSLANYSLHTVQQMHSLLQSFSIG
jgi:trehalose 6-phosphate synthase/phosphatase